MKLPRTQRKPRSCRAVHFVLFVVIALGLVFGAQGAQAGISPSSGTLNLRPGESGTENKTVEVPAVPSRADIQIAIDTTGSMGGAIEQAKTSATQIVNDV